MFDHGGSHRNGGGQGEKRQILLEANNMQSNAIYFHLAVEKMHFSVLLLVHSVFSRERRNLSGCENMAFSAHNAHPIR